MNNFNSLKRLITGARVSTASRDGGSYRGTIAGWRVPKNYSQAGEDSEHQLARDRASDLYVNDWAARSVINAISTNTIGSGLMLQARLPWQKLGISRKQAKDLESDIEWLWSDWTSNCHAKNKMTFGSLQLAGFRSILKNGEMLHLPVMLPLNGRRLGLAIQDISPVRLSTPIDFQYKPQIRGGVEFDNYGAPVAYWIATPPATINGFDLSRLPSIYYTRIPARVARRPGIFHLFFADSEEQARGESILAPGMVLFRHLSDSIQHELFSQIALSSLPFSVETDEDNVNVPEYMNMEKEGGEEKYFENIEPGAVIYLEKGRHLKTLESARPSQNFLSFCELVIRALAASADLPYEAVMKDFSKTNYSSARAALLEAWRVYTMRRSWFAQNYCQPIYNMFLEEAYLRGLIKLPENGPDFYEAMNLWCNASWIGPARGYVDPVKETNANIMANEAGLKTRKEILAEQGWDFEEVMDDLEEEAVAMNRLLKIKQKAEKPEKKESSNNNRQSMEIQQKIDNQQENNQQEKSREEDGAEKNEKDQSV